MKHIFREYDIRGVFGEDLNRERIYKIGHLLAKEMEQKSVFIGNDARVHCKEISTWLKEGLSSGGVEIFDIGMVPTPVAYFATFNKIDSIECKNSIMITGSHNPPQYNGLKITINNQPFYGEQIQKIAKSMESLDLPLQSKIQKCSQIDALNVYIEYLSEHFKTLKNFPYKIAIDCGNGVAGIGMEKILKNLNIKYEGLYTNPDGTFPNHHPDPSEEANLKDLKETMKQKDIKIGLAYDGDGDRIALLSQNHYYRGDELAILFARKIAKEIAPKKPIIIGEVKCSKLMYEECNKIGSSYMYKTGHSNLKVKLKELNASLAAEMSGHMFFNDRYFGYDDALYASLRALELFLENGVDGVENQIQCLPKLFSTDEEKIQTTEERKFGIIEELKEILKSPPSSLPTILELVQIDGVRVIFENGWGLIRASNTTPVLVTRFEADSKENLKLYKDELLKIVDGLL